MIINNKLIKTHIENIMQTNNIVDVFEDNEHNYVLMFDGGCRGNPGPSGAGYVIYNGNEEIAYGYKYIGVTTNNVAEYTALILGLKTAVEMGINNIIVKGDSKLVINQLQGVWNVKADNLVPFNKEAKTLMCALSNVRLEHIKRSFNKRADLLANEAMNTKLSKTYS